MLSIGPINICSNNASSFWEMQDWKLEKKSSDIFVPDSSNDNNIRGSGGGNGPASDLNAAEATPLLASARLSHIGRSQLTIHTA